jgi:xanthine phosphoribosyltransferase
MQLPKKKYDKVLAIGMGGLIPAYYVAKFLGAKRVEVLTVSSYGEDRKQRNLKVLFNAVTKNDEKGWLIVDDLLDSGETVKFAKALYPKADVAVLYEKPYSPADLANYCVRVLDGWVTFPWETN